MSQKRNIKKYGGIMGPWWWYRKTMKSPPVMDKPNLYLHIEQFLPNNWGSTEKLLYNKWWRDYINGKRERNMVITGSPLLNQQPSVGSDVSKEPAHRLAQHGAQWKKIGLKGNLTISKGSPLANTWAFSKWAKLLELSLELEVLVSIIFYFSSTP